MINYSEVYICSDQPTTCPQCGVRCEIIMDLGHSKSQTQINFCRNKECGFEFITQNDLFQND